jgi:tRNA dimethylallyltransferase
MNIMRLNGSRMLLPDLEQPVIFIIGPTASGKTSLSIQLAKRFDSEIISADSRYFYRKMDIGTAKPSNEELGKVKHYLIDIADPDETVSVAEFKQTVTEIISTLHQRKKIPFVVGGTGQYIHAIIKNWKMPEIEADQKLRTILEKFAEEHGKLRLFEFLEKFDPDSARIIDYRNVRRTIRAVEVMLKTGQKFSTQRSKESSPFSKKIIGIHWTREVLYQRIDQRIEMMIENGFIDEVRTLLELNYSPKLPSMSAIGYREIVAFIRGEITLDEAIVLMKRNSREYVRRQANWFKVNDPEIKWFEGNNLNLLNIVDYLISEHGWIRPE